MAATFDGDNLVITLPPVVDGVLTVDMEKDLYSDWKEWMLLSDNVKYPPAFRTIGGDALTPGIDAGAYFFIYNDYGWRIRPYENDGTYYFEGNLAPQDSGLPILIETIGAYTVLVDGLQPITQNIDTIKDSMEFSLFEGGVWLDINSSWFGTGSLVGTLKRPVNNLTDALAIATEYGLKKLYVLSDLTGVNKINSGSDLSDFIIVGQSRAGTTIEIDTSADTEGLVIRDCTVYGVLDGNNNLEFCDVGTINYFNGTISNCGLFGTINLDGDAEAVLNNCYTIDQDNAPVIDMGGSGQDLSMPNYSGLLTVQNLTSATEEIGIGLNSGQVILENTITNGTVIISGVGDVVDSVGEHIHTGTWNTNVTVVNSCLSQHSVSEAVWNTDTTEHTQAGTFGEKVAKKLLTVVNFLGLK